MSKQDIEKFERASFEEMVEYWSLEERFNICQNCFNQNQCWSHNGAVYHPEVMFKICRNKKVLEAVKKLETLNEKKPNLFYYAISGDFLRDGSYDRMMKIIKGVK